MIAELIEKIKEIQKEYDENINDGVSDKDTEKFITEGKNRGIELPEQYINFLKLANGVEANGHLIYGMDENIIGYPLEQNEIGFFDYNEIWSENDNMKKYVFFGDADISWFVYDKESRMYCELDKPSGRLAKNYDSCNEMLSDILTRMTE